MKSVLISIKPQWCEKIASGKKTIEVRKSAPKEVPFKAYIYCTKSKPFIQKIRFGDIAISHTKISNNLYNGKVIGEFICNAVEEFHEWELSPQGKFAEFEEERLGKFLTAACLSRDDVFRYRENLPYYKTLYGWHITDLKIYDKPKKLSRFRKSLDRVWCSYFNDFCEPNCIGFNNADYVCNDYWKWEKGLTRPPQSWCYVEEKCL